MTNSRNLLLCFMWQAIMLAVEWSLCKHNEHFRHLTRSSKVPNMVERNCKGIEVEWKWNWMMRCHARHVGQGWVEFLFDSVLFWSCTVEWIAKFRGK